MNTHRPFRHDWFRLFLLLVSVTGLLPYATAQSPADLNEGSRFTHDSLTGTYEFSWWSRTGNTYFIQYSLDLKTWRFFEIIETGSDAIKAYGFSHNADHLFVRLNFMDVTAENPATADFDGDGIGNLSELQDGTNPLDEDTDHDGLWDGSDSKPLNKSNAAVGMTLYTRFNQ
ncbi:MAG: hypothetical protein SFY80_02930 [Verrucomicrobiota bacterium]|nr:hypothetical protein [Verrucomicrobiota bacterium]